MTSITSHIPLSGARVHTLAKQATLVLPNVAGSVVSVERGCIWLTMESDTRDIVLGPGMAFEVDRNGVTIVAAEEPSRVRILPDSSRASWTSRLAALWTRNGHTTGLSARNC